MQFSKTKEIKAQKQLSLKYINKKKEKESKPKGLFSSL